MRNALRTTLAVTLILTLLVVSACSGSQPAPAAPQESKPAQEAKPAQAAKEAPKEAAKAEAPKEIKVAYLGPMSGGLAQMGQSSIPAIQAAIDEINAKGGIDGAKFVLFTEDDKGNPSDTVSGATRLIEDKQVVAIIGPMTGSSAFAALPVIAKYQVPALSPTASPPGLTQQGNKYFFRIAVVSTILAGNVAKYAMDNLKLKKFAIMTQNDDFGKTNSVDFAAVVKSKGGTVVAEESHLPADKEFKAQLLKIKAANPEALFLSGFYTEGGMIAKQASEIGLKVQLLATNPMAALPYRELGGAAVDGTVFSVFYWPGSFTNKEAVEFVNKWKAKTGKEPDLYNGPAYDSMMLLAEAAKKGGTTREGIRNGLAQIKGYQGVTGETTFTATGDVEKQIALLTIKNGQVVPLTVMK